MEDSGGMKFAIDKLTESNFHVWKYNIELVLGAKELSSHITEDASKAKETASSSSSDENAKWFQKDAKARAVIGLSLGKEYTDHVVGCSSARAMWTTILDLFQKKTLLNQLRIRRRFYSAKMGDSEKAMAFISRVRQLASDCKAMDVKIDDKDIAMTVLCGLPSRYEHLIVAIDAAADDKTLSLEFVKSRLLQEEQRMLDRGDVKPSTDTALVTSHSSGNASSDVPECSFCGKKYHNESKCWKKHPHLKPKKSGSRQTGLAAQTAPASRGHDSDDEAVVCLMTRTTPSNDSDPRIRWIIDSGATAHICNDSNAFSELKSVAPFEILIGDKSSVQGIGRGTVEMTTCVSGKPVKCRLMDVVYSPTMAYNMLSVRVMSRAGKQTIFNEHSCHVVKDGKVLIEGYVGDGLYCLNIHNSTKAPTSAGLVADINLWHQRLAHVHVDGIRHMCRHNVVEGMNVDMRKDVTRCEACVYGKSTRAPIPQQGGARAENVLDLVHTDVCGPFPEESLGGSKYFVSFVDDHSRFAWIFPIQSKSDVFAKFKAWLVMVENQHDTKLKILRPGKTLKVLQSDNGGEYISSRMMRFLEERGIKHRLTAPRNPHQNGVAERMNRTLIELVRSMLHQKSLPKSFWAEALNTAVHIRNRVTTRGLSSKTTPFEVLFGRKPTLSYLRVFGSRCWYTVPRGSVDKLDPRAREGIMIGYARGIRGYKVWDTKEGKVIATRDVRFDELGEYDAHGDESPAKIAAGVDENADEADTSNQPTGPDEQSAGSANESLGDALDAFVDAVDDQPADDDFVPDDSPTQDTESQTDSSAPRRSARAPKPRKQWWKGDGADVDSQSANVAALISKAASDDPTSFSDAVSRPNGNEWRKSMKVEHDSLIENKCWKLVPRPSDSNVLRSKWVYKRKEEQTTEGTLGERLKSRVVAGGNGQIEGVDFSETYAPVVKLTSIRVILSIVAMLGLLLHQMDFVTAFLNGDLNETVYMEQPRGFEEGDPAKTVCLLLKSIYGLKQSPRQWYAKIDDFFIRDLGMESNPADECVYVRRKGGQILIIALYVDDILIACSSKSILDDMKQQLTARFKMKDLGESRIILGMDITRDYVNRTISLSQSRYAQKVIDRFGMSSAREVTTPMDSSIDLTVKSEPCSEPYREAIGSLMYLMVGSRPDLAYCIGNLSKHVQNPTAVHWDAVTRVIRYVIRTKDLGLVFGGTDDPKTPLVYVDADWAGDCETRRSMSGYVAMMGGAAVAWGARPQEVVALSSAESEYISMCNGARETVWLRRLVSGMKIIDGMDAPTTMLVDNQAAKALANNSAVNRRNKHIDVRFHYTRQVIQEGALKPRYCCTEEMVADMMTKPLGRVKLQKFRNDAGLHETESAKRQ